MDKKFLENKKLVILVATGLFPPQEGGPATYSSLLLRELPKRGFEVKIQSFGWVLKYPKILRHLIYFFKIFFSAFSADVIYAQDPVSVGLPSLIAAKFSGKPFLLKIVGDYAWEQSVQRFGVTDLLDQFSMENNKYPFSVRILKRVQRFVANHADRIVVPSKYLKMIISNWGIDHEKISVVYNAFHPPYIEGTKEELKKKYNFSGTTIISAGRLVPWKGFSMFIEIMSELSHKISNPKLYIVGSGPDYDFLHETIKKNNVSKFVELIGKKPQKELFEMIKAADLFVLNTSYEGLSHQLLEVLALGTPIITTPAGGNVETIDSNINGLLVPYNDKTLWEKEIADLVNDKVMGQKFVAGGHEKIKSFGQEKMLGEISAILNSVAK
jgi:glycosyltransferase involved in cell wall biosynthesis